MRQHPHFSRSPRADHVDRGDFDRAALHALWHLIARHDERRGERGGDAHGHGSADGFGRRHGHESHEQRHEHRHGHHRGHHHGQGHHEQRGQRTDSADTRREFHERGRHHGRERFSLHALWHAIGRHHDARGGGRGGRFGGGPGGFGGEGDGFPRGRKFSSDDLQLLLLSLIDAQPSHGYELIKALETRSNGFYSPSPGMVYPALTYLEELGYVTVQLEGNRKRYELSETGRDYLSANRERVELMLAKLSHIARKMDSVRRALAGEEPADISEGGWAPELNEARRTLKHALLRRDNAPAAEQRRIAEILMRAAREIESADASKHDKPNDTDTGSANAGKKNGESDA